MDVTTTLTITVDVDVRATITTTTALAVAAQAFLAAATTHASGLSFFSSSAEDAATATISSVATMADVDVKATMAAVAAASSLSSFFLAYSAVTTTAAANYRDLIPQAGFYTQAVMLRYGSFVAYIPHPCHILFQTQKRVPYEPTRHTCNRI